MSFLLALTQRCGVLRANGSPLDISKLRVYRHPPHLNTTTAHVQSGDNCCRDQSCWMAPLRADTWPFMQSQWPRQLHFFGSFLFWFPHPTTHIAQRTGGRSGIVSHSLLSVVSPSVHSLVQEASSAEAGGRPFYLRTNLLQRTISCI